MGFLGMGTKPAGGTPAYMLKGRDSHSGRLLVVEEPPRLLPAVNLLEPSLKI